jgi:hypothetical protein
LFLLLPCRVDVKLKGKRKGAASTCRIQADQLKVTTPDSFWTVVELTADRGVLTAPFRENLTDWQEFYITYPPIQHDDYLPDPALLNEGSYAESTLGYAL